MCRADLPGKGSLCLPIWIGEWQVSSVLGDRSRRGDGTMAETLRGRDDDQNDLFGCFSWLNNSTC